MKTIKFLYLVLFFCTIEYSFGQITKNPYVESIPAGVKIEKVEIDDKHTIINVLLTEMNSNILSPFILFPSTTILFNDSEELSSNVLQNLGGFDMDVKYATKKGQSYRAFLFFDKIPAGVEKISIVSSYKSQYGKQTKWFHWKGISINNPLNVTKTGWNEVSLKEYYQKDIKDSREGIYERVTSDGIKYKLGLISDGNGFKLIFLSSDNPDELLKLGNVKAELTSTANNNLFKVKWVNADGRPDEKNYITFKDIFMEMLFPDDSKHTFVKLFPTSKDHTQQNRKYASSGTGFLISTEGYIVTNHHVIQDANKITVRGLNGDFSKNIKAKLVVQDVNNDLAIIKTDGYQIPKLTEPPYVVSDKKVDSGNSIFCLGYPLRATMGDEIKLTNGIVSSKSGFQGAVNSYQISAPVQPGNSGGPLFDNQGNLIGIINAKHIEAENASYAIKASYLKNLIDLLPTSPKLQTINLLKGKTLTQQVRQVKNFVFIIETEK